MDKSVKNQIIGLLVILLIILLVVISFITYNHWPLLTGQKIVLSTMPVDPFDPFMGQYMRINYEISSISSIEGVEKGDKVFVSLKEDDLGIWRYQDSSMLKPTKGDFIKGKVESTYGSTMRVSYGIEQFFFEKGDSLPTMNITIEVKVASSGRAGLVKLLYNGEPIEIEQKEIKITS
ncbi:MAG: GDYXXLXY domain-containing protein [archaeon]